MMEYVWQISNSPLPFSRSASYLSKGYQQNLSFSLFYHSWVSALLWLYYLYTKSIMWPYQAYFSTAHSPPSTHHSHSSTPPCPKSQWPQNTLQNCIQLGHKWFWHSWNDCIVCTIRVFASWDDLSSSRCTGLSGLVVVGIEVCTATLACQIWHTPSIVMTALLISFTSGWAESSEYCDCLFLWRWWLLLPQPYHLMLS